MVRYLVLGEPILDIYISVIHGQPAAKQQGSRLNVQRIRYSCGGASAVAYLLAKLGHSVTFCGPIGADRAGLNLIKLFRRARIRYSTLVAWDRTPSKTRFVSVNKSILQTQVAAEPSDTSSSVLDAHNLDQTICDLIPKHDVIVLVDYRRGFIGSRFIQKLKDVCGNKKLFVDTLQHHLVPYLPEGAYIKSSYFRPTHEAFRRTFDSVISSYPQQNWVISAGSMGMYGKSVDSEPFRLPAVRLPYCVDPSGAGDTVLAVLAHLLGDNTSCDFKQACVLASIAGAYQVTQLRVSPIPLELVSQKKWQIGVDWDGTYSSCPSFWRKALVDALLHGIQPVIVTCRTDHAQNREELRKELGWLAHYVPIVFSDHHSKKEAAQRAGYNIHVWVDDMPSSVEFGDRLELI